MKRAFSLVEVIFAIALLSLLVILTLPSLGSTHQHVEKLNQKSLETMDAVNLMEASLARKNYESKRFHVVITPFKEGLELVEVVSSDTGKTVLQAYRPQEEFYAN